RPGRTRIENARIHVLDSDGDRKAEIGIGTKLRLLQRSGKRGIEERARDLDRHPRSRSVLTTGPACVDQPAIHVACGDPPAQQIAVDTWMARHERGTEAGG